MFAHNVNQFGGDRGLGENDDMIIDKQPRVVTKTRPVPPMWMTEGEDDESDLGDSDSDTDIFTDSDTDDDEPLSTRQNANTAYVLLKGFISRWRQRKRLPGTVAKVPANTPDGKDRVATLDWLYEKVIAAKNLQWDIMTVIEIYLYVTNGSSDAELSDKAIDILISLNEKVSDIFEDSTMSEEEFRDSILQGIKQRVAIGLGNPTTSVVEYLDALMPENLRGSDIELYNIYCVTINGVPHLVLNNQTKLPFSVEHPFNRTYEHYKRNPAYKYAEMSTSIVDVDTWQKIRKRFTFIMDGSSDTDVSRLFWKGSRSKTLSIKASDVIAMATGSMTVPNILEEFVKLLRISGEVAYLIAGVGVLDVDKDWPLYELYKEVVTAQEKLWKQASENRSLMSKTLQELEGLGLSDGFHIIVSNNMKMELEERKNKMYVKMCSGINPDYEKGLYRDFLRKTVPITLFEAWSNDKSVTEPLAILFASNKNGSISESHVELFCKNQRNKTTRAARFIFPYAIKYLSQEFDYISLEAVPLAVPFYETYGFIRVEDRDDWILPVQKGKRKFTKATFDPVYLRKRPRLPDCKEGETFNVLTGRCIKNAI